jgi:hypothetical protein
LLWGTLAGSEEAERQQETVVHAGMLMEAGRV